MAIDEREYMKSRYRERRHLRWNDSKGRVEYDEFGSSEGRKSRAMARAVIDPRLVLGVGAALAAGFAAWVSFRSAGTGSAFPASGSVTIARDVEPNSAKARLRIRAGRHDSVVQLLRPSGGHLMSIYIRHGDERIVPVPEGRFGLRVAYGTNWVGTDQLFGAETRYERARRDFVFTERQGHYIELNRRIEGNLLMTPERGGVPRP